MYTNLAIAVPVLILFFGSLLLASINAPDHFPIGATVGLGLLMLLGLAGWWMSRQVFKSL
ncbi:MAG: hypothetical protein KA765_08340 [Thermoflexales bacterium]|nr:hypothetical protein [Thermoflexales bacterium]